MQTVHTETKRKAYGYVRVSTDAQSERGDSLDVQRRAIELICQLEGFDLVAVYADPGTSAGIPLASRPEGQSLINVVAAGDMIVGTKLDRLFRDAADAAGTLKILRRRGVGLYLKDLGGDCTDSSVSALVFGLLSNVAEFERARIRERVKEVKASQRAANRFLGGKTPLGYRVIVNDVTGKQHLEPDAVLQTELWRLRSQGYSSRLAAGHLIGLGYEASHTAVCTFWRQHRRVADAA